MQGKCSLTHLLEQWTRCKLPNLARCFFLCRCTTHEWRHVHIETFFLGGLRLCIFGADMLPFLKFKASCGVWRWDICRWTFPYLNFHLLFDYNLDFHCFFKTTSFTILRRKNKTHGFHVESSSPIPRLQVCPKKTSLEKSTTDSTDFKIWILVKPVLFYHHHPATHPPTVFRWWNSGLWTKLWHFDVYENATALSAEHVERQSKVFRGAHRKGEVKIRENCCAFFLMAFGVKVSLLVLKGGFQESVRENFLLLRSPDFILGWKGFQESFVPIRSEGLTFPDFWNVAYFGVF